MKLVKAAAATAVLWAPGAQAILKDCAGMAGVKTGIPVDGCSIFTNTECLLELRYGCDLMYPAEQYSEAGIPCGFAGADPCIPEPNISFPHPEFDQEALIAVASYVSTILPRGEANTHGSLFFPNVEATELYISEPTGMNITFVGEGGCQRNSLGLTVLPGDEDPRDINLKKRKALLQETLEFSVIFPNVDFRFCQCDDPLTPSGYADFCTETKPPLERGSTMRLKPDFRTAPEGYTFPADIYVVFFVIPDAFDLGFSPTGVAYTEPAENLLFSTPELNDPDFIRKSPEDVRQHALAFRGPEIIVDGELVDFSEEIFFAFEDRRRFEQDSGLVPSNNDFEDIVFFVRTEVPLIFGEPSAEPSPVGTTEMPSTLDICSEGLISQCGDVCCPETCGQCGGCGCAARPGGADQCCPDTIRFIGMLCVISSDVACVIDPLVVCDAGTSCPSW